MKSVYQIGDLVVYKVEYKDPEFEQLEDEVKILKLPYKLI